MPKLQGFAFLKTLSNQPKVIVTTAYKEYALEGYELNIMDYFQVYRSFMVAKKHIRYIEGNQVFLDNYNVPIGKLFKVQLDLLLK